MRRRPLAQQHVAWREIEPGAADVPARRRWPVDRRSTRSPSRASCFPGSRPCRRRRARTPPVKMRTASPAPTRARERMAGRDLADQPQPRRHARDVGGAHRVAVHRRDVGRRLRAQRARDRRRARGHRRRRAARVSAGSGAACFEHAARALRRPTSAPRPTPSRDSGPTCRRSSRPGGCPRCACRARPPSPCRRW